MNTTLDPSQNTTALGWQAKLDLRYTQLGERTVLSQQHFGPLRVQRPFFPEGGVNHTYVLHPPGGMVGDDQLDIQVHVADQSHALITTPGATKAYRNICNQSKLSTRLHVDGILEWLPQEMILFDQSRLDSQMHINLGARAKLISWEIQCIGRPSGELPYQQGHARFRTSISNIDGLMLHDNLLLEGGAPIMTAPWGIHGHTAIGVMIAYPANIALRDQVREQLSASQYSTGVTLLDDLLVVRAMAAQAKDVRALFVSVWQRLRPLLLARNVCSPRIWNT